MLRRQVALGVLLSVCCVGTPSPSAAQLTCPETGEVYAQCPNFGPNGDGVGVRIAAISDLQRAWSTADDFTLRGQRIVRRIRWWGAYLASGAGCGTIPSSVDDFTVRIWGDMNGNPTGPDPLSVPPYTVTRTHEPVGTIPAAMGSAPAYEYELTFPGEGFQAPVGGIFWLEVTNSVEWCNWYWLTAPDPPGDGTSRQRWNTDLGWSNPATLGFDLAFSVTVYPGEFVPTVSAWGLTIMGLLLLTARMVINRRHVAAQ